MECKHGIKPRFKEKEKVIADIEDYELKENMCVVSFACYEMNCCYSVIVDENCKYYDDDGGCNSSVARTNAMIMELKGMGFKHVNLNG